MIAFIRDLLELGKSRITSLVVVTTAAGFVIGSGSFQPWRRLLWVTVGTACVSAGASVFNHIFECDLDRRMSRTADRPLPSGRRSVQSAVAFGSWLTIVGTVLLTLMDVVVALLGALAWVSYLGLYTPLKRRHWLATLTGALPGALPPLMGWVAATGRFSAGGWVLFAILFLWQMPHSYAIAWLLRDQYRRAGMKLLSVDDPGGRRTARQTLLFTVALVAVSLVPMSFDLAGPTYTTGAALLGMAFVHQAWGFVREVSNLRARRLMLYSVAYLPLVLGLLVLDRVI